MPINPSDPPDQEQAAPLCEWQIALSCVPNPIPVGASFSVVGSYTGTNQCAHPAWHHWIGISALRPDPNNPDVPIWTVIKQVGNPGPSTAGMHSLTLQTDTTEIDVGAGEQIKIEYFVQCNKCRAKQDKTLTVLVVPA